MTQAPATRRGKAGDLSRPGEMIVIRFGSMLGLFPHLFASFTTLG
jgi:hypothetical protein